MNNLRDVFNGLFRVNAPDKSDVNKSQAVQQSLNKTLDKAASSDKTLPKSDAKVDQGNVKNPNSQNVSVWTKATEGKYLKAGMVRILKSIAAALNFKDSKDSSGKLQAKIDNYNTLVYQAENHALNGKDDILTLFTLKHELEKNGLNTKDDNKFRPLNDVIRNQFVNHINTLMVDDTNIGSLRSNILEIEHIFRHEMGQLPKSDQDIATLVLNKYVGKMVNADLKLMTDDLKKDLAELRANHPFVNPDGSKNYIKPAIQERYKLLEALEEKLINNPDQLRAGIKENIGTPLYQYMGGLKFLSIKALIDKNIVEMNTTSATPFHDKLSTAERVAIFGYTTNDYSAINPALRNAKGNVLPDEGLEAYTNHIRNAMNKLPKYQINSEEDRLLYRGINPPTEPKDWMKRIFEKKSTYKDFAFGSSSTSNMVNASLKIIIEIDPNSKVLDNAVVIGKPYTAWDESEVLFNEQVVFKINEVVKDQNGIIKQVKLGIS